MSFTGFILCTNIDRASTVLPLTKMSSLTTDVSCGPMNSNQKKHSLCCMILIYHKNHRLSLREEDHR